MAYESPSQFQSNSAHVAPPEPLSQTGQLIGWGIYGCLLVIGFAFGIVTGYERPKTIAVAKAKEETKPEMPKPETTKPESTKPTPPAITEPVRTQPPTPAPKDPPSPAPKTDPKPMTTTPKNDPKPPMPMTTTPKTDPKTDPPAKKEDLKPVSFKTDVMPILRIHCLNCHGAVGKPKGEVDLRTIAALMKSPSENNKMLVVGKPDESDFYTCITKRDMPKDRPKPSDKEMLVLKNWILTGAKE